MQLKSIKISQCENLNDIGIRTLSLLCPNIEILKINDCAGLTDKGITFITDNCRVLREVHLCNMRYLTDKSVRGLFKVPTLRHLNLADCTKITDKTAKDVYGLNFTPKIEELNLAGCTGISTNGLRLIISKCKYIQKLTLDNCSQVTDCLVNDIVFFSKELRYLSLSNMTHVNEESLNYLAMISPKKLETIVISGNPHFNLPDVRNLVSTKKYNIIGSMIDIVILRNRLTLPKFTIKINEFDRVDDLVEKIIEYLNIENPTLRWKPENLRLRKVTYRKNGTKRPGVCLTPNEYSYLLREVLERKHHFYLEQDINEDIRSPTRNNYFDNAENNIFISIRLWNSVKQCPEDVKDITVNSSMSLLEFKNFLFRNRIVSIEPQNMLIVEEETDLRINILIADSLTLSLYGIISGDVIHVEEITPANVDNRGQIIRSMTAEYLMKKKTNILVQETEESFERRKKNLGFRNDLSIYKFEIPIKSSWTFFRVKKAIAKHTGIGTEFLKISTRVEPFIYLNGNSKSCIDVMSGNLWLLLDIDSEEMLQEKMPLWVHKFDKNCRFNESKCITVRKTTAIKLLKELIYEHFGIPDDRQVLSRISSKVLASKKKESQFLKTIYMKDDVTIEEINLRHIRVDEVDRDIRPNDMILHLIKYSGIRQAGIYKSQIMYDDNDLRLFLISGDANLYELKREICRFLKKEKLCQDQNFDLFMKFSNGTSLNKTSFFEVKKSLYNQDSNVNISSFLSNQDMISWSVNKF